MRYFSTFSGIGGFELGIQKAYEYHLSLRNGKTQERNERSSPPEQCMVAKQSSSQPFRDSSNDYGCGNTILGPRQPICVGYSETNPYAKSIYSYHFPKHINYGDIRSINPERLPDFDLLVGGFPCQAFSTAGKQNGFDDPRGNLFFEIVRIAREKKPHFLLLENVKGLLSHQQGQTLTTILSSLYEVGYDACWQVLNSKHFGVPQNRERVFIMGYRRGEYIPKILPLCQTEEVRFRPQQTKKEILAGTLTARQFASWNGNYIQEVIDRVRRLTPLECERLQGFPDMWTAYGIDTKGQQKAISDARRYMALGNAVTVSVVARVCYELLMRGIAILYP
ncbi:MAG: DNA (cytosine-5-)-methyltransferase [Bacteroidota bacterium]